MQAPAARVKQKVTGLVMFRRLASSSVQIGCSSRSIYLSADLQSMHLITEVLPNYIHEIVYDIYMPYSYIYGAIRR